MTLFNLPRDVLKIILAHNSAKDLCKFPRISRAAKSISDEDALWRDLLIKDFHFTAITAQALLQRLIEKNKSAVKKSSPANHRSAVKKSFLAKYGSDANNTSAVNKEPTANSTSTVHCTSTINYKFAYQYCKTYQLNPGQLDAVTGLCNRGLTAEHLRGRDWFFDDSRSRFTNALTHLMTLRKMDANTSMAEIDDLNAEQAHCLTLGLTREQVTGLNSSQAVAFQTFHHCGLTVQHLVGQDWLDGELYDNTYFIHALIRLISMRNMDADTAMAEIDGLDADQAYGISSGLIKSQVTGLKAAQVVALVNLQHRGLTAEHLRGRDWFSNRSHTSALNYLMIERNMDANTAMTEIDGLTAWQADGIADGLNRSHVIGLKAAQVGALVKLKHFGLTAEHLRGRDWFDSYPFIGALMHLMFKRNMDANTAMAEIDGLNFDQASAIASGLTKKQVTGFTMALAQCDTRQLNELADFRLANTPDRMVEFQYGSGIFHDTLPFSMCKHLWDANPEISGRYITRNQIDAIYRCLMRERELNSVKSESQNADNANEENPDSISHIGPKRRRLN